MSFKFSDDQIAIRDAIQKICADFSLDYWLECDNTGNFPKEFVSKVCEAGWFGIAMPEEYGGLHGSLYNDADYRMLIQVLHRFI